MESKSEKLFQVLRQHLIAGTRHHMQPCCEAWLDASYLGWLEETGATDHPWMRDNLCLIMRGGIGSAELIRGGTHKVYVAYTNHEEERFTWAQHRTLKCAFCRQPLDMYILSSNAMFYLMRITHEAADLFYDVELNEGILRIKLRDEVTDIQVERLREAMETYKEGVAPTEGGIDDLTDRYMKIPELIANMQAMVHWSSVLWLLFHEIGHSYSTDEGWNAAATRFIDQYAPGRTGADKLSWTNELAADLRGSAELSHAKAVHVKRSSPQCPNADQVGRTFGFAGGILALQMFGLNEVFDIGSERASDPAGFESEGAFASHPPVAVRMKFLELSGQGGGGIDKFILDTWRKALSLLFDGYTDRYPPLRRP